MAILYNNFQLDSKHSFAIFCILLITDRPRNNCQNFPQTPATKVSVDQSMTQRAFTNLQLSYRGSERQPPSVLSLALTFSAAMQEHDLSGRHSAKMTTDERLKSVIDEYHCLPGLLTRYRIDDDKRKAVLNLLQGTSKESRALIQGHLDFHRWKECAFTADLLKSSRWLLGAVPRNAKDTMKRLLVVTPTVQQAFLKNVIWTFAAGSKKVKASSRGKLRLTQSDWDQLVDYTCIMMALESDAKDVLGDEPEKRLEVVNSIEQAFYARTAQGLMRASPNLCVFL